MLRSSPLTSRTGVHERRHRLSPWAYRGTVVGAFTMCTANRASLFLDARVIQIANTALTEAFARHGGHVGVYVFMPDHLHLMVSGRDATADLLAMVSGFKRKTAFRVHKAGLAFEWQKDFYDHLVRANEDYGAQVRYLLRNPVRKGLSARWQDWPHKGVLGQTWEDLALNVGTL